MYPSGLKALLTLLLVPHMAAVAVEVPSEARTSVW